MAGKVNRIQIRITQAPGITRAPGIAREARTPFGMHIDRYIRRGTGKVDEAKSAVFMHNARDFMLGRFNSRAIRARCDWRNLILTILALLHQLPTLLQIALSL